MMENDAVNKQSRERQNKKYEKKDIYDDRQVYELWWNFLKLSKRYEIFCKIMRSVKNKESESEYKKRQQTYLKNNHESAQLFDEDYYPNDISNWEFMGDVHQNNFIDWWTKWKVPGKKTYSIINLRDSDIRKELPRYRFSLNLHNRRKEKPPTPDEVIKYLTSSREYMFVAIPLSDTLKTDEIRATISKMRKTMSRPYRDKVLPEECRFRIPYGNIRYSELKKYHEVYKSMNVDEMTRSEAKTSMGISDSSVFSKHMNIARSIIKNVEEGIFPGREYRGKSFLKKV